MVGSPSRAVAVTVTGAVASVEVNTRVHAVVVAAAPVWKQSNLSTGWFTLPQSK